MTTTPTNQPVLFFDGICNLCNSWVQFVIRNDKKKQFLFAPLQSDHGRKALAGATPAGKQSPDSLVLLDNGKYYTKSDAALRVAKLLGGYWRLLYAGVIFPRLLRDSIYDLVARNRYKWFGKQEECMIPAPGLKERFL